MPRSIDEPVAEEHGDEAPPPSWLAGIADSGGSDVARFKDEYVGEAVEAQVLGEAPAADAG